MNKFSFRFCFPDLRRGTRFFFLFTVIVLVLLPLFFMVKFSISDRSSIVTGGAVMPLWPHHVSFQTYRYFLFENNDFIKTMFNSLQLACLTICFSMILGAPAAYVLSRFHIPGKIFFIICLISVRFFPDICSVIPIVKIFIWLGLYGTFTGAALAHTLLALPYVIFIAQGVFESIPADLEEQATVLGASRMRVFTAVILPLVLPGLAAAAIYTFLLSWDEFIFVYFLLKFKNIETVTLFLKSNLTDGMRQENFLAAISILLSLPVIFFTFVIQRYMKSGIIAGAIK